MLFAESLLGEIVLEINVPNYAIQFFLENKEIITVIVKGGSAQLTEHDNWFIFRASCSCLAFNSICVIRDVVHSRLSSECVIMRAINDKGIWD